MMAGFTTIPVGNMPPGRHSQLRANRTIIRHHRQVHTRHVDEMRTRRIDTWRLGTWLVGTRPRRREINPVLIPTETEVNPGYCTNRRRQVRGNLMQAMPSARRYQLPGT